MRTEDLYARAGAAIVKRRNAPLARLIARGARSYLNFYEGFSFDMDLNGETRALAILAADAAVVFDVGANVGAWTRRALQCSPAITVHAFEIVPRTSAELARRFSDVGSRAVVNAFGLSDAEGIVPVNVFPGFSEHSSLTHVGSGSGNEWHELPVRRGDSYASETGIDHIDLLKIDAEGADLRVIKGFGALLDDARIQAIQFEYGAANLTSRDLLADFYALLEPRGYAIGKISPDRVEFKRYRVQMEDFLGPNYLAVHASRADLIARLKR